MTSILSYKIPINSQNETKTDSIIYSNIMKKKRKNSYIPYRSYQNLNTSIKNIRRINSYNNSRTIKVIPFQNTSSIPAYSNNLSVIQSQDQTEKEYEKSELVKKLLKSTKYEFYNKDQLKTNHISKIKQITSIGVPTTKEISQEKNIKKEEKSNNKVTKLEEFKYNPNIFKNLSQEDKFKRRICVEYFKIDLKRKKINNKNFSLFTSSLDNLGINVSFLNTSEEHPLSEYIRKNNQSLINFSKEDIVSQLTNINSKYSNANVEINNNFYGDISIENIQSNEDLYGFCPKDNYLDYSSIFNPICIFLSQPELKLNQFPIFCYFKPSDFSNQTGIEHYEFVIKDMKLNELAVLDIVNITNVLCHSNDYFTIVYSDKSINKEIGDSNINFNLITFKLELTLKYSKLFKSFVSYANGTFKKLVDKHKKESITSSEINSNSNKTKVNNQEYNQKRYSGIYKNLVQKNNK